MIMGLKADPRKEGKGCRERAAQASLPGVCPLAGLGEASESFSVGRCYHTNVSRMVLSGA